MSASPTQLVPSEPASTFTPSLTSGAPASSSGNVGDGTSGNGSGPSPGITHAGSELYLFTFLTTLLLLLGVSCAIIIRSLILRRRFRRRVQEAIANGVFVPGLMDHGLGSGRAIGEKPVMWDVWIAKPKSDTGGKDSGLQSTLPISATRLPDSRSSPPLNTRAVPPPSSPPSESFILSRWRQWRRPRNQSPPNLSTLESNAQPQSTELKQTLSSSSAKSSALSTNEKDKDARSKPSIQPTQLSLLIAMPSASRPVYDTLYSSPSSPPQGDRRASTSSVKGKAVARDGIEEVLLSLRGKAAWPDLEEGEVPYLEMGVVDVGYTGGENVSDKTDKREDEGEITPRALHEHGFV